MRLRKRTIIKLKKDVKQAKTVALMVILLGLVCSAFDIVLYAFNDQAAMTLPTAKLLNTLPKLSLAIFGLGFLRKALNSEGKLKRVLAKLQRRRHAALHA